MSDKNIEFLKRKLHFKTLDKEINKRTHCCWNCDFLSFEVRVNTCHMLDRIEINNKCDLFKAVWKY
jgi:hypothetical protein